MPNTKSEVIVLLIFMTIFILMMVTFIIIILFFVQKKQRKFNNDLLEIKSNHDLELYRAQSEIQEQTLLQIAGELHDNVGQNLSLAKLSLSTLDLDKKDEAIASILEISDIIEISLHNLRLLTRCMNTEIIRKGGLIKTINMQVDFIQRGGKFNAQLGVTGEPKTLPDTKEIFLFRIVQEAINNIIRHSKASDIWISLEYAKNFLALQVRDNGNGFILDEKISGPDLVSGIHNMQRRAKIIEAEFEIDSQVGKGTCIKVITPY
ncbi:MAG TPA: ATP-binding protein [Cytophagaceae bacterium]|nr:ATP-binding protein [Cytophagaceae bacterium]